jgi:hypothetical protein
MHVIWFLYAESLFNDVFLSGSFVKVSSSHHENDQVSLIFSGKYAMQQPTKIHFKANLSTGTNQEDLLQMEKECLRCEVFERKSSDQDPFLLPELNQVLEIVGDIEEKDPEDDPDDEHAQNTASNVEEILVFDESPPMNGYDSDNAEAQHGSDQKEDAEEFPLVYHSKQEVEKVMDEMALLCKLCQRSFHSRTTLQRHVAIKHKVSLLEYETIKEPEAVQVTKANVKQKKAANKSKIDKDNVTTSGAETPKEKNHIQCTLCSQNFGSLSTLRRHALQMHKDNKKFNSLMKHIEVLKVDLCKKVSSISISCIVCGEECPGTRILRHLKMWHADLQNLDEALKLAKSQYNMKRNAEIRNKNVALVKCPHCSKELKASSIHCHMKYRCRANPERRKLYECSLCGFGSIFEDAYQKHMQSHLPGQKDYTCSDCGKMFRAKAGLQMHQRIHHGLVRYYVKTSHEFCLFYISVLQVMKVPLQKYTCEACHKTYTQKAMYERHLKSKHSGKLVFKHLIFDFLTITSENLVLVFWNIIQ